MACCHKCKYNFCGIKPHQQNQNRTERTEIDKNSSEFPIPIICLLFCLHASDSQLLNLKHNTPFCFHIEHCVYVLSNFTCEQCLPLTINQYSTIHKVDLQTKVSDFVICIHIRVLFSMFLQETAGSCFPTT